MSPRKQLSTALRDESPRLSLDRCRRLLAPEADLGDGRLTQLREQLYTLAELVVSLAPDAMARAAMTEDSEIMEAEGLPRASAEREAALLHLRGRLQ